LRVEASQRKASKALSEALDQGSLADSWNASQKQHRVHLTLYNNRAEIFWGGKSIRCAIALLCLVFVSWTQAAEEAPPLRSGVWQKAASAPTARTEVASAVLGGKTYVIGGFSPLRFGNLPKLIVLIVSDAVEVYDPAKDRWRIAAPRRDLAGVEAYDPGVGRWREVRPLPTPRSGIAAAVLQGMIVVLGDEVREGLMGSYPGFRLEVV
jgi:hypothetical protein